VDGTFNLYQAAVAPRVAKVVLASSMAVYGRSLQPPPDAWGVVTEDRPVLPDDEYGLSNALCEELARSHARRSPGRPVYIDDRGGTKTRRTIDARGVAMPGQPAHFEIPADDTAKGRQFWGSLFDWQFEAMPGPFEYHMTRISDQVGVAVTNMEPGKRGIRTYFYVDDINAGAGRVKELGGEANDPGPVPGMGWFATCSDPQGNEFGLWQNDPSAPAPTG
jgi:predicted enzyme related to lactoylglutathione lyase